MPIYWTELMTSKRCDCEFCAAFYNAFGDKFDKAKELADTMNCTEDAELNFLALLVNVRRQSFSAETQIQREFILASLDLLKQNLQGIYNNDIRTLDVDMTVKH
jgi:hypothetical protein